MGLMTPSVNVPAEREKLRRMRNEINTEAQARIEYERKYTARGYRRAQLPSLPSAQTQPAFWPGADDLPELLRAAGSQDAARQGTSQDHAGRDCPAPRKPAARAGVAAGV